MSAYAITDRSIEKMRNLVKELHEIATFIRQSGPSEVRFEAQSLCHGIGDVNAMLGDLTAAMATIEPA